MICAARSSKRRRKAGVGNLAYLSFALMPHDGMVDQLRSDYRAMTGMIFDEPPAFNEVLASVQALEGKLNEKASGSL